MMQSTPIEQLSTNQTDFSRIWKIRVSIVIFSIILFVPFIGSVHLFDWDEINFAESAREMIVTGDYSTVRIDYKAFHEKPPFFIWMQVLSMKVFGINEFAARFPNTIVGMISILVIFNIGNKLYNYKFGIYWAVLYAGSFLPHFYFKTALIDPTFNILMFVGVYYLYKYYQKAEFKNIILASAFVSLAVLTKGPVGYLLPTIVWVVYHLFKHRFNNLPIKEFLVYTLISFAPIAIWYIYIALTSSSFVLNEFIQYHIRLLSTGDAGHSGPFYYHFVVLLIGCFPSSIIAINSFYTKNIDETSERLNYRQWNIILFLVVLVVFSVVQTKILHYSSLCYFPITFLAANSLYNMSIGAGRIKKFQNILLILFGFIWAILMLGFPYILANKNDFLHLIKDKVTYSVIADNSFNISLIDFMPGIALLCGTIIFIIYLLLYKKDNKYKIENSYIFVMAAVMLAINLLLPFLAPKIEYALQGKTIEFYKKLKNQDAFVITAGFKSYAPYFYNERKYENSSAYMQKSSGDFENYLLTSELKKNVYIITKLNYDTLNFQGIELNKIYNSGGFIVYERMCSNKAN